MSSVLPQLAAFYWNIEYYSVSMLLSMQLVLHNSSPTKEVFYYSDNETTGCPSIQLTPGFFRLIWPTWCLGFLSSFSVTALAFSEPGSSAPLSIIWISALMSTRSSLSPEKDLSLLLKDGSVACMCNRTWSRHSILSHCKRWMVHAKFY